MKVRWLAVVGLCVSLPISFAATDPTPAPNRSAKQRKVVESRKPSGSQPSRSAAATTTADPLREQALQTAERDRLTTRVAELKKQIAAGEKSRSGAAAALTRAERALAEVTRRLDELVQRQKSAQDLVATLDRQKTGTDRRIAQGEDAFARTLRRLDVNRDRDPLRLVLEGGDPNEATRIDADLGYVLRSESAELDALDAQSRDLSTQRKRADDENRALLAQAEAQKTAREAIASDQAAQQQTLAKLSQQIAAQRSTAAALENDEKRLTRVVEQLQRVIEQQAAADRARREAARREAARKLADEQAAAAARKNRSASRDGTRASNTTPAPTPSSRDEAPERVDAVPDETVGGGAFAQLRGQLRLPVRGSIVGRFGAPRGSGGGTWKGVFVKTDTGAEVRAVAAGHVVFADDLRGFGNLLIVDHGNQYLSIYGNNETLLKRAGDAVKPGDVIARAGNSGGDEQTGLYFELRFQGRPFDPMSWIGGR